MIDKNNKSYDCQIHSEEKCDRGKEEIALRTMLSDDIPELMRLKKLAGWNQLENDWKIFLTGNSEGCFVTVQNGRITGTVTAVNFHNKISWIGMVLVDPEYRRMGIATKLMNRSIESQSNCGYIKLDATPEGRNVYLKLGFKDEFTMKRVVCDRISADFAEIRPPSVVPVSPDDLPEITAMDTEVFGAERTELLQSLFNNKHELAFKKVDKGRISGFCFARDGSNYTQIGPVAADNHNDAYELIAAVSGKLTSQAVLVDIPDLHVDLVSLLTQNGFCIQRSFIRMCKASPDKSASQTGNLNNYFCICGPEFG